MVLCPKVAFETYALAAVTTKQRLASSSRIVFSTTRITGGNWKGFTTRNVCRKPEGQLLVPSPYCPLLCSVPSCVSIAPSARSRTKSIPELNFMARRVNLLTVALAATSCQSSLLPASCVRLSIFCSNATHGSIKPCRSLFRRWILFHLETKRSASSTTTISSAAKALLHGSAVTGLLRSSIICLGVATAMLAFKEAELS
mmetsp:Transcript_470/g.987  ORF Transcript_470/g.987 Transcript_470/m.987 type:complete len:200 (+) Transcript_470:1169-1768(+)